MKRRHLATVFGTVVVLLLALGTTTSQAVSKKKAAALAADAPATLDDWWNGTASWSQAHYWSQKDFGVSPNDGGFGAGPSIVIGPDGVWNWFYRTSEVSSNSCTGNDNQFTLSGTLMRRSSDKGATWEPPVGTPGDPVVLPGGDPLWNCFASDGDAIWDGTRWHYVFQCLASQTEIIWRGCHVTNSSVNPLLGTWVSDPANPILGDTVPGARLWDQICDDPADDCVRIPNGEYGGLFPQTGVNKVGQAGTWSLFEDPADPGWFYMDFHGVDNAFGYQYFGVAKTKDFHTWIAKGPNLPTDAIYDRLDARTWREPTAQWDQRVVTNAGEEIGGGGNAVFPDPVTGRYYALVDASNGATCVQATAFDQGVMRSSTLASSSWEQPTAPARQNPLLYSEQTLFTDELVPGRCGPSYSSFFNDPTTGETYLLFYGRSSADVAGDYLFVLKDNLLVNGDAMRCIDTAPWQVAEGGSFNIWRDGVYAADGMCYFALASPVWQDVVVPAGRSWSRVSWGGSFNARQSLLLPPMGYRSSAGTGAAVLTLTQLSSTSATLSTATQTVSLTGNYTKPAATTAIDPAATSLRYTITPQGLPALTAVLADEMFIRPV